MVTLEKSARGSPVPAAGAGGQDPPRRSGAGAGEPPAIGAAVPAMSGRVAPLFQSLGRASSRGWLGEIGRG